MTKTHHPQENTHQHSLAPALSADEARLRRRRSNALGIALGVLAVIFFSVTILKMAAQLMLKTGS